MIALIANHLWQSTLIAAIAGLLILALRHNHAHVRYCVWLAASVKFLVPFSALSLVGSQQSWRFFPASGRPEMTTLLIDAIGQPFSAIPATNLSRAGGETLLVPQGLPLVLAAVWSFGCAVFLVRWLIRWHRVSAAVRQGLPVDSGHEVDTIRRLQQVLGIKRPLPIVAASTSLEPGVSGIIRPVLLWPVSIGQRLDDRQVEAILAHEICHVRRRDNLAAAVHMLVEALFWFHPLVWWIGARLVDERERACDEEVVRLGLEPQTYAESILKTCQLYLESPLLCVAGVTGSDLKRRIERIMKNETGARLNSWKKILIAATALMTVAAPVVVGALNAPGPQTQSQALEMGTESFASVSIKENTSGDTAFYPISMTDGRFVVKNHALRNLIGNMYFQDGRLWGWPDWLNEFQPRFDIEATAEGNPTPRQMRLMVRKLLADRFKLVVHKETRDLPVYALVLVKKDGTLGPRIRPSDPDCIAEVQARHSGSRPFVPPAKPIGINTPLDQWQLPCGSVASRPNGIMAGRATTMPELAFGGFSGILGRKVVDKTGLAGYFDFELEYTPAVPPGPPPNPLPKPLPPEQAYGRPAPSISPSFFTAMQEQLGLDLASETGPVELVVIDHVEKPQ
jgi:bla regulator protein BlaR1